MATAKEQYRETKPRLINKMNAIINFMNQESAKLQDNNGHDWGHVGSLAFTEDRLDEIIEHHQIPFDTR